MGCGGTLLVGEEAEAEEKERMDRCEMCDGVGGSTVVPLPLVEVEDDMGYESGTMRRS